MEFWYKCMYNLNLNLCNLNFNTFQREKTDLFGHRPLDASLHYTLIFLLVRMPLIIPKQKQNISVASTLF